VFGTPCRPCIQVSILRHKRTSQFNIAFTSWRAWVRMWVPARAAITSQSKSAKLAIVAQP
jgi:hypothetical protein